MSETELETGPPEELSVIEPPAGLARKTFLFLVAAVVIIADQLTKLIVEQWLPLNRSWAPVPELANIFQFTHVSNTGAAFGLFPNGSLLFTLIAIIVAIIIVIYNYNLPGGNSWLRLALGLQLGGAMGNLIDRLRLGHVTDFLDFGPWPVFNLADTAVVAGVVVLGLLMLKEQKDERRLDDEDTTSETGDSGTPPTVSTGLPSAKSNEQAT